MSLFETPGLLKFNSKVFSSIFPPKNVFSSIEKSELNILAIFGFKLKLKLISSVFLRYW